MTAATVIRWQPEHGRQTAALRAAGLKTDDLRAAGFAWARSQAWEAPDTESARAIIARLAPANDNRQTALEQACVDAGIIGPEADNGVAGLIRQADRAAAAASAAIHAIPGGQPVGSTADANRRERSADQMRRATALRERAQAKLESARETARGLAHRLDQDAEAGERPRDMGTPKRMAQGMHARLDAAVARRAAGLLRAWADNPERLPNWRPHKEQARQAVKRSLQNVPNGWHSYHVEGAELCPSTDPTILALRAAYPEAMGDGRETPAMRVERLEAAVRFSPIPGFFPTPQSLIKRMMELADIRKDHLVLEPSAGNGNLADAARLLGAVVNCVEIAPRLREILGAKGHLLLGDDDFMAVPVAGCYDRIVANPPFESGQDRNHIRRMFDHLKPGGRLVAVCSTGPFHRTHSADVAFREWLDDIGAEVEDVEPGAFAGADAFRKTGVAVKLIVADRRA